MAYLDQGMNNPYSVVIDIGNDQRYKVTMSTDGTVVTSEKTSLPIGVYPTESDSVEKDNDIANSILSLYSKSVTSSPNESIMQWIGSVLRVCQTEEFLPIDQIPKMTKALATNLSGVKEAMVFHHDEPGNKYLFVCFGYRRVIADALADVSPIFVFADRFFTGASFETRFKKELYMIHFDDSPVIAITNDPNVKDKISLVMTLDWQEHTKYLESTLLD